MFHKFSAFALPSLLLPAVALLGACGEEPTDPDTTFEEAQPAPVDMTNPDEEPVPDNEVGSGDPGMGDSMDAGAAMLPADEAN